MSALLERQRAFMAALRGDGPCEPGIAVYRDSMRAAQREALAAAFPRLCAALGEEAFDALAERYGKRHPSTSGDLHAYGRELPGMLDAPGPHGTLASLARLEWARHEAYHAEDAAPLDYAALAAVAARRLPVLRLRTHPALRLVRIAQPLAVQLDDVEVEAGASSLAAPQCLRVCRDLRNAVRSHVVTAAEWRLLEALRAGETLGDAWDAAAGDDGDGLGAALARNAALGVFCGFTLP